MPRGLIRVACFLAAIACAASGCNSNKITDADLVHVNIAQARELVHGKKKLLGLGGTTAAVWVDARNETDFSAGHIPDAINLPFERVSKDHRMLRKHETLIVYGGDYNDSRAEGMSKRLMELGHGDVRTLIGGLRAWKSEGNELETSTSPQ